MEALMDRSVIAEITTHFKALSSIIPLHTISSEHDYDKAVATLNQLLDAGAANEEHPLADLPSADARPDCHHFAGNIAAGDNRKFAEDKAEYITAFAQQPVTRIDATGTHPHQHLAMFQTWQWHCGQR